MSDQLINQEAEQQANFPQEVVQDQKPDQEVQKTKDEISKENSLRILRERAEAAERRALEVEQLLRSQQQPQQIEEEDDFDIKDEDYVEGKHVKKPIRKLQKELKETQKKLEEQRQYFASATAETRLKSQFSDFDSVVTEENIKKLATTKPALYRSMMANPDLYDKGYTAYEMIKYSGVYSDEYSEQDQKLEQNKSKPRSSSAAAPQVQENPLARTADYDRRVLTEERKEQLRRQVEEAKRNR